MPDDQYLSQAAKDLSVVYETTLLPASGSANHEAVITLLQKKVEEMVTNDMDRFIQMLYILDIPEKEIMDIMTNAHVEDRTRMIAIRILQRQIQKVKTKAAYKKDAQDLDIDPDEKW